MFWPVSLSIAAIDLVSSEVTIEIAVPGRPARSVTLPRARTPGAAARTPMSAACVAGVLRHSLARSVTATNSSPVPWLSMGCAVER